MARQPKQHPRILLLDLLQGLQLACSSLICSSPREGLICSPLSSLLQAQVEQGPFAIPLASCPQDLANHVMEMSWTVMDMPQPLCSSACPSQGPILTFGCPGDCHLQSASPMPEPHRPLIPTRSLPRFPCHAQLLSLPTTSPEALDLQLLRHGRHLASAAAKLTQAPPPSLPAWAPGTTLPTARPPQPHARPAPGSSPHTHPLARAPAPPDHTVLAVLAFQTSQRFHSSEIIFTASRHLRQCQLDLNATLPRGQRCGQTGWAGRQKPTAEPPKPAPCCVPHGHAAAPAPAACHAAHRRPGQLHRGGC